MASWQDPGKAREDPCGRQIEVSGALAEVPGFFDLCSTPNPSKSKNLGGRRGKEGACRCLDESAGSN